MKKKKRQSLFMVECNFTYGWDDAGWTVNGKPQRFASEADAQAAIDELIKDTKEAVSLGHMEASYDRSDYRTVPA